MVLQVLMDWGITDSIEALCCDTTNANLGSRAGAAVLLEKLLDRDLLYLPCRHHIFEIVLSGVFDLLMPASSGPSIALFKRFQSAWDDIDTKKYKCGIDDSRILTILQDYTNDLHLFIETVSKSQKQPRDDYRELLSLCLIFMGVVPQHEVKFRKPGAYHRARWMAKAIYCLKMYMFRDVFNLSLSEKKWCLKSASSLS